MAFLSNRNLRRPNAVEASLRSHSHHKFYCVLYENLTIQNAALPPDLFASFVTEADSLKIGVTKHFSRGLDD